MASDDQLIFVSIAAYRDVQLGPTVDDLLAKAQEPELLRFGICWQHGPEEAPLPFTEDSRFQILDVDWRDSRGACWARSETMKLWQGEQWFLQIDSHCRFVEGWDTKLIRMMGQASGQTKEQAGSAKPILSTYANSFTPRRPGSPVQEILDGVPHLIAIETFTNEGIPVLKPLPIEDLARYKAPVPARFLAAGFLFAPGSFVEEVPYDPELYFFGEETSMTVRAYTAGYDLFHPIETVAWHDYERAYAIRHWDDHAPPEPETTAESAPEWGELDKLSIRKVHQLLCGHASQNAENPSADLLGRFGLGSARTLAEYERYAGLSFALKKMQDYTRLSHTPPNPPIEDDWPDRIYTWMVRIAVPVASLPPGALDEGSFWVVTIQNEERREIRRHDFKRKDMTVSGTESEIVLICEMQSGILPVYWNVAPFSKSRGWGVNLYGTFAETDYSIISD